MKQRIISAIVAIIICTPIVIIGKLPFFIGASILGLIGFMELINAKEKEKKIPVVMKMIGVVLFVLIMMYEWGHKRLSYTLSDLLIFIILLTIMPIVFFNKKKEYDISDATFLFGSIVFLGVAFNNFVTIRMMDLYIFIYLLLITIMSDTFAYFVGRKFGKHKMCPSVSPNKTWEGFVGGLTISTIVSTLFYHFLVGEESILLLILITILLSIIGALGDLVFSSIKRHFGIKDYGNIMPGHGGVLDRLDSILFVILAFSYLSKFL